jgi:GNAT superfamily N-acetyltransferase
VGPGIAIREATSADTEAVVDVIAAGWRVGYRGIVPDERLEDLPVERWRSEIGAGLASPEGDSFSQVAELDGEFAGYCYVAAPGRDEDIGPEIPELVAIYVEPSAWGSGIGTALIGQAEREAGRRGFVEMYLWTFAANERALGFYRARGWGRDGAERVHPRAGVKAVRLRKRVDNTPP